MSNNLVLVNPNEYGFNKSRIHYMPLTLLYLAGTARNCGICDNISVFDFNVPAGTRKTIDDLLALLESLPSGKTVVGITCLYSGNFPTVREIAAKVKERFPDINIATGGAHPTMHAKEIIDNCLEIDAVAIGESDFDFPKLLRHYYGDGGNVVSELDGYCLRIDGKTVVMPKKCYIQDLDALPRPGYEFFNFQDYIVDTTGWRNPDGIEIYPIVMPLLTSRSCPGRCNFCSVHSVMGSKYRARSAENVFEEIKHLHDVYGVNYFKVHDDNFTLNRKRIVGICEMIIKSGIDAYFELSSISIATLDESLIRLMRQAGVILTNLPVESGSDYIRNKVMGKNLSRQQILDTFKICKDAGIITGAYFVIGMPEETEDTLSETLSLLQEIEVTKSVVLSVARPYHGTKLFEQCLKDNLLVDSFNMDALWEGEIERKFAKQAYTYNFGSSGNPARHFFIRPYNLSLEKLAEFDDKLMQLAHEKSKFWMEHR